MKTVNKNLIDFSFSGTSSQSLRTVPLSSLSPSPPNKKQRRSILPKHATNTMKAWLFQHIAVILIHTITNQHMLLTNCNDYLGVGNAHSMSIANNYPDWW